MKTALKNMLRVAISMLMVTLVATPTLAARAKKQVNPFDVSKVKVAIENVDGMTVADFTGDSSQDIVLLGRTDDKQKQIQVFSLNGDGSAKPAAQTVNLADDLLFYDTGILAQPADQHKTSLIFLKPGKVQRYDMTDHKLYTLVASDSIYRQSRQRTSNIKPMKFLHDVNDDGLADILIPDFTHSNLFIQQPDGTFAPPQQLDIKAQMQVRYDNSAAFSGVEVFVADYNFDDQLDLVYRVGSALHVFTQNDGKFSTSATITPLTTSLPLSDEDDDFSKDQSNLRIHRFYKLIDLNNDKMLDLITKVTKSSGLLDKSSQYQFYFGHKSANTTNAILQFSEEPDSVISSPGMQFELELVDFNGDEQLDLVSPSFELGIGSIIASLFSSSADLDVMFHSLKAGSRYHKKPNLEKELSVDFDLSSGQRAYPLLKISDFDGDGMNDLLIGHGSKRVYLYRGIDNKKLFKRKPAKFRLKLPRNGQLIAANDLNNDGRTDLIVRYDKLDGTVLHGEMKILLSKAN